jgi:hypothetical protein
MDLAMKGTEQGFKGFCYEKSKLDKIWTVFRNTLRLIQKVANAL